MFNEKGKIYRITLEKDIGFTFAKARYLNDFCILTPLDILTADATGIDLNNVEEMPPLCYDVTPLMSLLTRGKWKRVKEFDVDVSNQTIPDFKNDVSSQSWDVSNWSKINTWYLVRDMFPNGRTKVKYSQVSHLGPWQHSAPDLIRTKLTMFWLKKLGNNIKEIYKGEIDDNDYYWNQAAYFETLNLTFYQDVDPKLWNRMKE